MQDGTVWHNIFSNEGRVFIQPHEDMERLANLFQQRGVQTILDLGCGSGRHTLYFSKLGLTVYGIDNAIQGLNLTRQALEQAQLSAQLIQQDIYEKLPFEDQIFDAIISVKVLHHAHLAEIRALFTEITRILKPQGVLFLVVPKQKNPALHYEELEPGTFLPLDGREKGLPHHFFTIKEMQEILHDYEFIDSHEDSNSHYCFTAVKK